MDDDFNTSRALAAVLNFTKVINGKINNISEKKLNIKDYEFIKESLLFLKNFDKIFKLDLFKKKILKRTILLNY